jgi:hypothetical protein
LQKLKLAYIIGLNILLLILALWLKPRFQTNDDIGMIYAYSGTAIFDVPTAVTAFSTKTWGLMMVSLYQLLPSGVEAYTIVFFVLIFIANVFIHLKLFEYLNPNNLLFWLFFLPLISFITLHFYLELQFTMLSGLLCLAGVLLLMKQPNRQEMIIGYLFVLLGILVRPSVIPIVLAFFFLLNLLATYLIPQLVDSRKQIFKKFGLLALIFCTVYFVDQQFHTEREKYFIDFNLYRAGIVDYNIEKSQTNTLPPNWDKVELLLFKNWFYNDPILYSDSKNYKETGGSQKNNILKKMDLGNLRFSAIFQQFMDPFFRCVLILSIVPLFFIKNWKKSAIFLIMLVILYIFFYNLLAVFFKAPPFRVSFMMFTCGILMYLYFTFRLMENRMFDFVRMGFSGLLLIYGLLITKISLVYRYQDILKTRCIENYNPSIMYIRWGGYPLELIEPFKVSTNLQHIKIVSMGAFSIHPSVTNSFKNFKYENLTSDIIGMDHIVSFMMPSDTLVWQDFRQAYTTFIFKHYKRNIRFEKVENSHHCYDYIEFKLKQKTDAKLD